MDSGVGEKKTSVTLIYFHSLSYSLIKGCMVVCLSLCNKLTLKVLVTTIDAQWEGMGDEGSARYEPALLPPCPTIRVLSYSD